MNNFTTHSFDNCSKSAAHAKWVHNKENMFVNRVSSDVEKFDELQSLLSNTNMNQQGQGDSTKTCINEVVDKICDLFKCTTKRVFPTKNSNSPCNKSDKPWFNKSCLEKRKTFHTEKNRYSFDKNKENRDAMKKACKEFKQEKNKSYKNHEQKLKNELRKTSKQDSKTFWKILNRF